MADKTLKLDVDIATKQAQTDVKNLSKATQDLGTDFDETKSKGQQIADAEARLRASAAGWTPVTQPLQPLRIRLD